MIHGVNSREAFEFVRDWDYIEYTENYKSFFKNDDPESLHLMSREEYYDLYVINKASAPELRYVYFEAGITPVIEAVSVIDKLHAAGESDVTRLNVKLIQMSVYEDISVWYAKRAVIYYEENATSEHGEEAFEEYIEKILNNIPYEAAFWGLTYLEGWDDYSDIDISDLMSDSKVFDDYDFNEEEAYEDEMYDSDDDYEEFG